MSLRNDLKFQLSMLKTRTDSTLRPVAEKTTASHGFVRAGYLAAAGFLGIAFPFLWTPEPGFQQSFVAVVTAFSYVVFISAIVYMILYVAGVRKGWIETADSTSKTVSTDDYAADFSTTDNYPSATKNAELALVA